MTYLTAKLAKDAGMSERDFLFKHFTESGSRVRVAARRIGISAVTLRKALTECQILAEPKKPEPEMYTIDGVTDHIDGLARRYGISRHVVRARVKKLGWDLRAALTEPVNNGYWSAYGLNEAR